MPFIQLPDGKYSLRCINKDLPSHQTHAMQTEGKWLTLVGAEPKMQRAPGVPVAWTEKPRLDLGRGQPVRTFTCTVCGYVEIYDAMMLDPATWGGT